MRVRPSGTWAAVTDAAADNRHAGASQQAAPAAGSALAARRSSSASRNGGARHRARATLCAAGRTSTAAATAPAWRVSGSRALRARWCLSRCGAASGWPACRHASSPAASAGAGVSSSGGGRGAPKWPQRRRSSQVAAVRAGEHVQATAPALHCRSACKCGGTRCLAAAARHACTDAQRTSTHAQRTAHENAAVHACCPCSTGPLAPRRGCCRRRPCGASCCTGRARTGKARTAERQASSGC